MPYLKLFSCVMGRNDDTVQEQLVSQGNKTVRLQNVCWLLVCLYRCQAAEMFSCLPMSLELLGPDEVITKPAFIYNDLLFNGQNQQLLYH